MTLFEAIQSRSPSAVRAALVAEGDLAATNRDARGWTPLMAAAAAGHAGVARLVLRAVLRAVHVAGLRDAATGPDGLDALTIAAEHGHRPTFEALARWLPDDGFQRNYPKKHASPGRDFGDGATINRLVAAAADGRVDEVKSCLARGVEVDGYDANDRQAMREAVKNGHAEVVRALIEGGADPEDRSNWSTMLIEAAEAGHVAVIHALIDGGADPRGVQALRENALMKAVEKGQYDAARDLIDLGLDVNARDGRDRSALLRAIMNRDAAMIELLKAAGAVEPDEAGKELLAATRAGDLDRVRALIAEGVDLAVKDSIDQTALEQAVEARCADIVDALLGAGALDRETEESRGRLMNRAAFRRQPGIVRALLAAGADPDGSDGYQTALAEAAEKGDLEIVRILLDAGADPNADPGGGTALTFALRGRDPDVIALLRQHGAHKRYGGHRVEELRGAGSFDVNDLWLLVRAPVEDAARAFVEARGGAVKWDRDIIGRDVATSPLCYIAFRFRGHAWTLIRELRSDDWLGTVDESDAQEVSRRLGARAIYYGVSDTAGAIGYDLFEAGEPIERMSFDCSGEPDDPSFTSRLRNLSTEEIGSPFEFADAFLRDQDAFVPAFGSVFDLLVKMTPETSFGIGGMEAEDFDRADIIHLPAGAVSARMKRLREQRHGDDIRRPWSEESDDEDVPF
jgi:ankyrin repeat protein